MKTDQDILKEYTDLRHLYYGRDEAITIVVQNILDSNEYRMLKDSICENYIKTLINVSIPPSTF